MPEDLQAFDRLERKHRDLSRPALPVAVDDAGTPGRDVDGPSLLLWLIANAPPCPEDFIAFGPEITTPMDVAEWHALWAAEWAEAAYEASVGRERNLRRQYQEAWAALRSAAQADGEPPADGGMNVSADVAEVTLGVTGSVPTTDPVGCACPARVYVGNELCNKTLSSPREEAGREGRTAAPVSASRAYAGGADATGTHLDTNA